MLTLAKGKPERSYTVWSVSFGDKDGGKDKVGVLSPVLPLPMSFLICVHVQEGPVTQ